MCVCFNLDPVEFIAATTAADTVVASDDDDDDDDGDDERDVGPENLLIDCCYTLFLIKSTAWYNEHLNRSECNRMEKQVPDKCGVSVFYYGFSDTQRAQMKAK